MNVIQALIVMGFAVASSTASNARQAEVQNFNGSSNFFQLIQPGFRPLSNVEIRASERSDTLQLGREFAKLVSEPLLKQESGIIDDLIVPAWMRSNAKTQMPNVNLTSYSSVSLKDCGTIRYAPHPDLNASQELRRERYYPQVAAAACLAGVPVDLFDALIIQESRYNPFALSSKGASGLTQLMPGTARSLGVFDRWSISQNLSGGARYLRKQLDTFGNWPLALGAYNAGPGNVETYHGLPPFKETRGYVRTILSSINSYRARRNGGAGIVISPQRRVTLASFTR
jgi:hypothetical protein